VTIPDLPSPGNPWAIEGVWLRGNLHCHSTGSDGRLAPQEVVDRYAARGDGFLAISDHNTLTDVSGLDPRGMCLLPAAEITCPGGELGTAYHVAAAGVKEVPPAGLPAREVVPLLRAQGAVVFAAHPHWSGLTVADILGIPGFHGVEIHNGATVLESSKGEALAHWDELLGRGARLWGIAADDMHWGSLDLGLAWVHVRASDRTPEAVLAALAAGHFYSSSGPELVDVRLEGDGVLVRCSPCLAVYCLSFGPRNQIAYDRASVAAGQGLRPTTEAAFRLSGGEAYVRVQAVDAQRRAAWSNPLFLRQA